MLGNNGESEIRATFCCFEIAMVGTMVVTFAMGASALAIALVDHWKIENQVGPQGPKGEHGDGGLLSEGSTFVVPAYTVPAHTYHVCAVGNTSLALFEGNCP